MLLITTLVLQDEAQGYTLIFLGLLRSLSLSRIIVEFFLKPIYPTVFGEIFQIYGVKIIEKGICESKNWIYLFLLMPPYKTIPQVLIITL